jgi:hypothetical protein
MNDQDSQSINPIERFSKINLPLVIAASKHWKPVTLQVFLAMSESLVHQVFRTKEPLNMTLRKLLNVKDTKAIAIAFAELKEWKAVLQTSRHSATLNAIYTNKYEKIPRQFLHLVVDAAYAKPEVLDYMKKFTCITDYNIKKGLGLKEDEISTVTTETWGKIYQIEERIQTRNMQIALEESEKKNQAYQRMIDELLHKQVQLEMILSRFISPKNQTLSKNFCSLV